MLDRKLLRSHEGAEVQSVARTLTLAVVRRLDVRRKAEVVKYLEDSGLIRLSPRSRVGEASIFDVEVDLRNADLRGVDLSGAALDLVSLGSADLRGARFDNAELDQVDFSYARLQGASFRGATLLGVSFEGAKLQRTIFDAAVFPVLSFGSGRRLRTQFTNVCLSNARFRRAKIGPEPDWGVTFKDAGGRRVDFTDANVARRSLRGAYLVDAKLPSRVAGGLPPGWGPTGLGQDASELIDEFFCAD